MDIRADGGYVVLPPSKTNAGVYEYALRDISEIASVAASNRTVEDWLQADIVKQPQASLRQGDGGGPPERPPARLTEGTRNDGLFRLAMRLRHSGLTVQEIETVLARANQDRCEPALGAGELRAILESVLRYPSRNPTPGPEIGDYRPTDSGNAELLRDLYGSRMRFIHTEGAWMIWRANAWRQDQTSYVMQAARKAARKRCELALSNPAFDERQKAKAMSWALASEGATAMERALKLLAAEPSVATTSVQWDSDAAFVGVPGAVFDLECMTLAEAKPEQLIRKRMGAVPNPLATCPRWEKFLMEVFEGNACTVQFVQRLCGYSLLGDPQEQVWVLAHGRGANGKSVLLRALREVFGDYANILPFSALEMKQYGGIPNDIATLVGSRLAIATETSEGSVFDAGRLKALTGGEKVTARFLHREFFEFCPQFVLWMATNRLPRVKDTSEGFWRRAIILPFNRVFRPEERDPKLPQKLAAEYPGVFQWILQGVDAFREKGLDPPPDVVAAVEDYREDSDNLASFIAECGKLGEGNSTTSAEAYDAYRRWANVHQMMPRYVMSKNGFSSALKSRFKFYRSNHERGFYGVSFLSLELPGFESAWPNASEEAGSGPS